MNTIGREKDADAIAGEVSRQKHWPQGTELTGGSVLDFGELALAVQVEQDPVSLEPPKGRGVALDFREAPRTKSPNSLDFAMLLLGSEGHIGASSATYWKRAIQKQRRQLEKLLERREAALSAEMSGASHDSEDLRREIKRLTAEKTKLQYLVRELRRELGVSVSRAALVWLSFFGATSLIYVVSGIRLVSTALAVIGVIIAGLCALLGSQVQRHGPRWPEAPDSSLPDAR